MAGLLRSAGERVLAIQAADAQVLGVNTIAELIALDATLRANTASRLMAEGVTIFRPETSVIDAEVEIAPDTIIEPFVQLLGHVKIGTGCRIRSYTVIENCTLGNNVVVLQRQTRIDRRNWPLRSSGRRQRSCCAPVNRPMRRSRQRGMRPAWRSLSG